MKIKNLAQKGKYVLVASILGMATISSFAAPAELGGTELAVTQQTAKIRGTILDAKNGEPIIGANVLVKGTTNGTITDFDGNYELEAPVGSTLTVSFIGYKTIEVKATAEKQTIRLAEDTETLDEVIVVGYTTQRKESLTGAMSNIKSDKLKDVTTPSVENMLNGKVPGVYVAPGSGQPGSSGAVVIRGQATLSGTTAPLWVIDGVIVGSDAGQLNPDDIESMTILKDAASTAIYGSQGANGVIVVTTKNARAEKMRVNASVKVGVSNLVKGNMEMMNGAELYEYYSKFQNADELKPTNWWSEDLKNRDFDWWDLATQTGFTQDYNISLQGGNEKLQSFFSLGYYDEEGAVKGYDYSRYSFRLKNTYKPFEWLTIKPSLSGSYRNIYNAQYDVTSMYRRLPWDSPYAADGSLEPDRSPNWIDGSQTNYLLGLSYGNYSEGKHYEFMGNFDFDIKITDWLTFSSVNNLKYTNSSSNSYTDPRTESVSNVAGRLTESRGEVTRRYTNQKFLFNKSFDKHFVTGLLAYEFNDYRYKNVYASGTGFVPGFEVLDVVAVPEETSGGISEWAMQSYFTQWKYTYDNKYMAEVSLRRDGRSNFGDNAKYGNFFSFSAGWNINNEEWFKADWVDNLKLRASYGSVGNAPSSLYPQYDLYSVSVNYDGIAGALISQIGNKELTWEKTYTTGIGLDASMFNNRLRFNFDYYIKDTDNILYSVPVTGLTGVTNIWRNVGEMRNTGFEIAIGGDIIRTKDLTWSVDLNIGHNENELRDLYKQLDANGNYVVRPVLIGDGSGIAGSAQCILEIGEAVDTYYIREWAGVDPQTGAPMWYMDDENGNKVTTTSPGQASYYKCGSASPDLFGGFNTSLTWKNFDLSAVFGYSIGGKLYNYARLEYDSDGTYTDRNQMKLQDGWSRWEKPGDIATHPAASYGNKSQANIASSRYLEDGDYLKLRSLTLGYNLKLTQWGIQNMRVYLTGENLFTWTKYSGLDPEIPASNGSVMKTAGPGLYPSVRKFMFGLNLTF